MWALKSEKLALQEMTAESAHYIVTCGHISQANRKSTFADFSGSSVKSQGLLADMDDTPCPNRNCQGVALAKFLICQSCLEERTRKRLALIQNIKESPEYQYYLEVQCQDNPRASMIRSLTPDTSVTVKKRAWEAQCFEWRQFLRKFSERPDVK